MKKVKTYQEWAELLESGAHIFCFTTAWCGDCHYLKPSMLELEREFVEWHFIEIDRDDFSHICDKWQIEGIPSFVAVANGVEKGRFVSRQRKTKEEVAEFLRSLA